MRSASGQVIVPGSEGVHENSSETSDGKSMLIMSGGEGYIDFRIGKTSRSSKCDNIQSNSSAVHIIRYI